MSSFSNLFLLILVFPSLLVPSRINGVIIENSNTNSCFEIIQNPSGLQIPAGTNLSLKFKPTRSIFNDIESVLIFYCIMDNETSSCTNPVHMTQDKTNLLFRYSIPIEDLYINLQFRYRFIAYFSNGTPLCFPNSYNNQNIVQGETGLYYFSIEIVNRNDSREIDILILSLATFSAFSIFLILIIYSKPYKKGHRI